MRLSEMPVLRKIELKGIVEVLVRDAETLEVIDRRRDERIITDNGLNLYARRIASGWQYTSPYGRVLDVGTGTGTPSATDTDLFSPIIDSTYGRIGAKSCGASVSNNLITFGPVRYDYNELNGYDISEVGLWDPAYIDTTDDYKTISGGMVEHGTFTPISKTSSIILDVYVYVQLTR